MTQSAVLLSLLLLTTLACREPAGNADSDAVGTTQPTVEYEAAYPADVSSEELSEADVAQQETTHAHGEGEEHSHGEGDHEHGEAEENDDHQH